MADPIVTGAKAEVTKVEASVTSAVSTAEADVLSFGQKYWYWVALGAAVLGAVVARLV